MKRLSVFFLWVSVFPWLLVAVGPILAVSSCLSGNKGIDASRVTPQAVAPNVAGSPGAIVTTVAIHGERIGLVSAAGIFGVAAWRGRRYRQALDRTVVGVEMCGPDCDARKHNIHHPPDAVERVLHARVKALT